jgi:hypothetical protein
MRGLNRLRSARHQAVLVVTGPAFVGSSLPILRLRGVSGAGQNFPARPGSATQPVNVVAWSHNVPAAR